MKRIFNLDEYSDDKIYYTADSSEENNIRYIDYKNKWYLDSRDGYDKCCYGNYYFNWISMRASMDSSIEMVNDPDYTVEVYEITEEEYESILMLEELKK